MEHCYRRTDGWMGTSRNTACCLHNNACINLSLYQEEKRWWLGGITIKTLY